MVRRTAIVSLCLGLCLTTIACGSPDVATNPNESAVAAPTTQASKPSSAKTPLPDGQYPVQQANYDDGDGSYSLMLLNTPNGLPPQYRADNLAMARLTEEEVKAGQTSYLRLENGQPSLHLTQDFRIEYTHNVTEVQENPQTGVRETVVVRQESSFWTPFMGALAGQMVANALFTPHYYIPPVYQPGGVLVGYGGYGRSYDGAVGQYRQRYNQAPIAERNRQTFRTTGRLRQGSTARSTKGTPGGTPGKAQSANANRSKATGSGFGTSTLRRDNVQRTVRRPSNSSFGSSRSVRRPANRSFGSRGRRR